jgi:hypothetical protein
VKKVTRHKIGHVRFPLKRRKTENSYIFFEKYVEKGFSKLFANAGSMMIRLDLAWMPPNRMTQNNTANSYAYASSYFTLAFILSHRVLLLLQGPNEA